TTRLRHVLWLMSVVYPQDVLNDNWPFIELFGHEMRRRPNNCHATTECLLVRFCPHEGRQKGVMDVDHAVRKGGHEGRAQDAHVLGKNQKVRTEGFDRRQK